MRKACLFIGFYFTFSSALEAQSFEPPCGMYVQEVAKDTFVVRPEQFISIINAGTHDFDADYFLRCFFKITNRQDDMVLIDQTELAEFNLDFKRTPAFAQTVGNATHGNGLPRISTPAIYGNPMLRGYTRFNRYTRSLEYTGWAWALPDVRYTWMHELVHLLGCCPRYGVGVDKLVDGGGHLTYRLGSISQGGSENGNCTLMESRPYQEKAGDMFMSPVCKEEPMRRLGEFELYLTGLKPASARRFPLTETYGISTETAREAKRVEWITTRDIEKSLGVIQPPVQRDFRVSFVLVVFNDTPQVTAQKMITDFIFVASQAPSWWKEATDGLSTINSDARQAPRFHTDKDVYNPGDRYTATATGLAPGIPVILHYVDPQERLWKEVLVPDKLGTISFSGTIGEEHIGQWSESVVQDTLVSNSILLTIKKKN